VFSLSPIKIVIIIAVILIVLGPDKLPEVARQLGSAWKGLRQWQAKIESEVREVVPDLPSTSDIARIARSPVHLLNSLADRVIEPSVEEEPVEAVADEPVPDVVEAPLEPDETPRYPASPYAAGASIPPPITAPDPSLN
jgi:TatA/E family protein of Tat protein translocase